MHFRQCVPNLLAGRDRTADRFVCFSFFCFVWFIKLSTWLGSKHSHAVLCGASVCPALSLPCSALCPEKRTGASRYGLCPFVPATFWILDTVGHRDQRTRERHWTSILLATPARLGPSAEGAATPAPGSPFLQPSPLPCLWVSAPHCCQHLGEIGRAHV